MKRTLPPLNALRAFEASARLASVQRAAQELNVTPSAVSQQVQNLERWVGYPLLERRARRLQPTPQGRAYLGAVSAAFDAIAEATADLSAGRATRFICVTCTPGFAVQWLVPHLQAFQDLHPDIDVRIDASTRIVDLRVEDVDFAVRHGNGKYPGLVSEKLLDDDLVPAVSPLLLGRRRLRSPADLKHLPILHIETRDDWRLWFAGQGVEFDWRRGPLLVDTAIGVQAAIAGKGVILIRRSLIADELASGRLIVPLPFGLAKGTGYFLVYPPERIGQPALRAFRAWILEAVAETSRPAVRTRQ
jgi:LysR family transcriptional regulator, glycine cleavage system transcriptional activator